MHWTSLASPLSFAWPAVDNYYRHLPNLVARPDLAYVASDHPMQRLDLFAPRDARGAPVVLFFHGGGTRRAMGRRLLRGLSGLHSNVGAALAQRGYVTLVAGHRQGPGLPFSLGLEDAGHVLGWAREHAREHGGDPDRLVLFGHSAGGHLAMMAALEHATHAPSIRAVVSLGAMYDVERLAAATPDDELRAALGAPYGATPEQIARSCPQRRLAELRVPLLVGVAEKDPPELRAEYEALRKAAAGAARDAEFFEVPGCGHMGLVLAMGRRRDPVTAVVTRFLERVIPPA